MSASSLFRPGRSRVPPEMPPSSYWSRISTQPSERCLPDDALPEGEQWHPQTVRLWDALRRFPLLANEPELGWQFLIDTALMHHTMWTKGRWEFASEVRLRVAKYGATPEDRMRLKIKIEIPPSPPVAGTDGASVTSISSRRNRLSE